MVDRPNIVFITCHDLGKHLGCYGQETVNSPSLDRLAEEGVLFNNSFCTAPQCGPSRAALHTGRFSHANGMLGQMHQPFNWTLHADEKHLAERLRDVGYDTVMVGLQHVSQVPETLYNRVFPVQPAHELAQTVTQQLEQLSQSDTPFYLEVGFVEPHRPFDRPYVQSDASKGVKLPHYAPDTPEASSDFAMLQGIIRVMDEGVGQVLDAIDKNNLRENTWVIFVTDHGIAMPRAKGNLYDAGIETALMMRLPSSDKLCNGIPINNLISHVDIVPTLLEAVGAPIPDNLHGTSFWSLLHGEAYEANTHIFAEKTFHTAYEPMRCIRTHNYKLILNLDVGALVVPADVQASPFYPQVLGDVMAKRPALELFNVVKDPQERHNLAEDVAYQEIKADLSAQLLHWMESTDDPVLNGAITSNFQNNALSELRGSA